MIRPRILFSVAAVLLVLTISFFSQSVLAANQDDAEIAISSADTTLSNCYIAVKEAQAKGANVTALVATLNEAAGLLSKAEIAYSANDYDSAYNFAVQSQNKLAGYLSDSSNLEESAIQNNTFNFGFTVILPLASSMAILAAGLWVFNLLRRKEKAKEAQL